MNIQLNFSVWFPFSCFKLNFVHTFSVLTFGVFLGKQNGNCVWFQKYRVDFIIELNYSEFWIEYLMNQIMQLKLIASTRKLHQSSLPIISSWIECNKSNKKHFRLWFAMNRLFAQQCCLSSALNSQCRWYFLFSLLFFWFNAMLLLIFIYRESFIAC